MDSSNLERLKAELRREEGEVLAIYLDSRGFPTCGIGHLITAADAEYGKPVGTKISAARCAELFSDDVFRTVFELERLLPWVKEHPPTVQRALANMAFQLGIRGLLAFKTTLARIARGAYRAAADSGQRSLWAKQTPARAARVLAFIRSAQT